MSWTKAFLAKTRVTDTPAGDLIADMRADPDIPELFKSLDAMKDYFRSRGACREAMAEVPGVWRRYRAWIDRHPFRPNVEPVEERISTERLIEQTLNVFAMVRQEALAEAEGIADELAKITKGATPEMAQGRHEAASIIAMAIRKRAASPTASRTGEEWAAWARRVLIEAARVKAERTC
jgi:hypothetical protein